jgi:hypothetical protein
MNPMDINTLPVLIEGWILSFQRNILPFDTKKTHQFPGY